MKRKLLWLTTAAVILTAQLALLLPGCGCSVQNTDPTGSQAAEQSTGQDHRESTGPQAQSGVQTQDSTGEAQTQDSTDTAQNTDPSTATEGQSIIVQTPTGTVPIQISDGLGERDEDTQSSAQESTQSSTTGQQENTSGTRPSQSTQQTQPATEDTQNTQQTQPATENTQSTQQTESGEQTLLTYEEYKALSTTEQRNYYRSFADPDDFYEWLERAEEEYSKTHTDATGGNIDIGDILNGANGN